MCVEALNYYERSVRRPLNDFQYQRSDDFVNSFLSISVSLKRSLVYGYLHIVYLPNRCFYMKSWSPCAFGAVMDAGGAFGNIGVTSNLPAATCVARLRLNVRNYFNHNNHLYQLYLSSTKALLRSRLTHVGSQTRERPRTPWWVVLLP